MLRYDPETGIFMWRVNRGSSRIDKQAGCVESKQNGRKYLRIQIDGKHYLAHRLAFLYMTGAFPPAEVDHWDTNSLNNRWDNLRSATGSQNRVNVGLKSDNTTGFKGVSFDRRGNRYRARLKYRGATYNLGLYDTPEEAAAVYDLAAKNVYKEFALTNAELRSA